PRRTLCLPDDWVRNIGHLGLLDFWVKLVRLGWRSYDDLVVLAPAGSTSNRHFLKYWREYYNVVTDPYLIRSLSVFAKCLGSRVANALILPDGEARYFCEAMGHIQEHWEAAGHSPLLSLTQEDREHGWELLGKMGVPRNAWFVCVHVREPGFH